MNNNSVTKGLHAAAAVATNASSSCGKGTALMTTIHRALQNIPCVVQSLGQRFQTIPCLFNSLGQRRKVILLVVLTCFLVSTITFTSLYTFHSGFRRTIQFWKGMAPLLAEYRFIKFKSKRINRCSNDEYERRIDMYNQRTAPKIVNLILSLGGIYVKLGQVMSTVGQGLLPREYVDALQPLQDGVPPRDYEEITKIIESSTGKKMNDIFISFDKKPIGSASIAQAHKATLRRRMGQKGEEGEEVIVKVQYPEVANLFEADLNNLEFVTKLFMPENIQVVQALRQRHENELDFTIEAKNLQECTNNMQGHGIEPSIIRIPRVKNETGVCNRNVLVMEYLQGTSLSEVIEDEQDKFAYALGKKDRKELQNELSKRMRDHFEQGGGDSSDSIGMNDMLLEGNVARLGLPLATKLILTYGSLKKSIDNFVDNAQHFRLTMARTVSGGRIGIQQPSEKPIHQKDNRRRSSLNESSINLSRVLKTLVHVHGIQMLKDGVYNADPHPGNVLVLPDGRLGLLDYGMVGRLSPEDRHSIAKTIVALSRDDKVETAKLYENAGYRATYNRGQEITDKHILHRFATFHLNKFDLSPIKLENGEKVNIVNLLETTREHSIPSWVEEGRRLGGLLQGVSAQAARPISLAKEWEPIAIQALKQHDRY